MKFFFPYSIFLFSKNNFSFISILDEILSSIFYTIFIDKDMGGAHVIGRKTLRFQEKITENYEKLLKSQICIQYALWRLDKME
jgi:hypothetical protein